MKKANIKRITLVSILIALSVVFSIFDTFISNSIFAYIQILVPSFKLGLANLVILLFIYRFSLKESVIAIILKSVLVGFIAGGLQKFLIGFCGTLLSFIVMKLLQKVFNSDKSIIFVSLIGAVTHTIGQTIMAFILYGFNEFTAFTGFLLYVPWLVLISIATGALMGVVTTQTVKLIDNHNIIDNEVA